MLAEKAGQVVMALTCRFFQEKAGAGTPRQVRAGQLGSSSPWVQGSCGVAKLWASVMPHPEVRAELG